MTVQNKPKAGQDQKTRPDTNSLVRRYGQIGIAALAAALEFSAPNKKAKQASSFRQFDERFVEQPA